MSSYYIKKGAPQDRGCVDEDELRAMAGDGRLEPDDLVWIDGQTQGWVRAASFLGPFAHRPARPEPVIPSVALPHQPEDETQPATHAGPKHARRPLSVLVLVVLLTTAIIIAAVAVRDVMRSETGEPQAADAAAPSLTNQVAPTSHDWTPQLDAAEALLASNEVTSALSLLEQLREDGCETERLDVLTQHANALKQAQTLLDARRNRFREGQLPVADAGELVMSARQFQQEEALRNDLAKLLTRDRGDLNQAAQMLAVALALEDADLVQSVHERLTDLIDQDASFENCRQLLQVLDTHGESDRALTTLQAFVEAHTQDGEAWLELAGRHSKAGREDEALKALRQAEAHDVADFANRVQRDMRFEPLRDERTYRRLLR